MSRSAGRGSEHEQVGRYLMVEGAAQSAGRFDSEVGMYESPPQGVSSEQFYEADLGKPHRRAWSMQTVRPVPPLVPGRVLMEGGRDEQAGR